MQNDLRAGMKFCSACGAAVSLRLPEGDSIKRYVCDVCDAIHYENPRMIVGCLPRWEDKILLCKRANEPRPGKWTLPAGFLEIGESVEVGAKRETVEEANADIEIVRLLSLYSVPHIGQVYVFFLADLLNTSFHPGHETLETRLFGKNEIPWDEIAFPSVRFTLETFLSKNESKDETVAVGSYVVRD